MKNMKLTPFYKKHFSLKINLLLKIVNKFTLNWP